MCGKGAGGVDDMGEPHGRSLKNVAFGFNTALQDSLKYSHTIKYAAFLHRLAPCLESQLLIFKRPVNNK